MEFFIIHQLYIYNNRFISLNLNFINLKMYGKEISESKLNPQFKNIK